jgi:hypothetical protein
MDTNEHDALPWELHLVKLVLSGTVCSKSESTHKNMILYMNKLSQKLLGVWFSTHQECGYAHKDVTKNS